MSIIPLQEAVASSCHPWMQMTLFIYRWLYLSVHWQNQHTHRRQQKTWQLAILRCDNVLTTTRKSLNKKYTWANLFWNTVSLHIHIHPDQVFSWWICSSTKQTTVTAIIYYINSTHLHEKHFSMIFTKSFTQRPKKHIQNDGIKPVYITWQCSSWKNIQWL